MTDRFKLEHLDAWRRDGGVVIESFFNAEEIAAAQADFEHVFGRSAGADEGISIKKDGEIEVEITRESLEAYENEHPEARGKYTKRTA